MGLFCLWAMATVFDGVEEQRLGDDWLGDGGEGRWYGFVVAIAMGGDVASFDGGVVAEDICRGALQHQGRVVFCVGAFGGGWFG